MFNIFRKKRNHIVNQNGKIINDNLKVSHYLDPKERKKKTLKKVLLVVGLIVLGVLIWVGVGAFAAIGKIVTDNNTGGSAALSEETVTADQLKGEGDGRINILLYGVGGSGHPGGTLADSIEVVSINPKDKSIAMLSIPRDLRVKIANHGTNKINAANSLGEQDKSGSGPDLLKETISTVIDLPIHYYFKIDFSGFTKFIDALGGIEVDVPKALSDPYYPDEQMQGYSPFSISAGKHTLNGATALKYARSRETTSDFDRSARQQQIIVAAKDKALSAGVLANPTKISEILKILGDHLRTDMNVTEMERLFTMIKDVSTDSLVSKVLDTSVDSPLTSTNDGGYYIIPRAGNLNFTEVQRVVHELFADPYLKEENASITLYNATGKSGVATELAKTLKSYGYNIVKTDMYDKTLAQSKIIDYSNNKKPFTLQFLKNRITNNAEIQPKSNSSDPDIVIIIGKDYND